MTVDVFFVRSFLLVILSSTILGLVPQMAAGTEILRSHFDSDDDLKSYLLQHPNLAYLSVMESPNVTALPPLPFSLTTLILRQCTGLRTVRELPDSVSELWVDDCPALTTLPKMPSSLKRLLIQDCVSITEVPQPPNELTDLHVANCPALEKVRLSDSITQLTLEKCPSLTRLPQLPSSLRWLQLYACTGITILPPLPNSLTSMFISNCKALSSLPSLPDSLHSLLLFGDSGLISLPASPASLEILKIIHCPALTHITALPLSLCTLELTDCSGLSDMPTLPDSLTDLSLENLPVLRDLSPLPPKLTKFAIKNCPSLVKLDTLPSTLSRLDIDNCSKLASLPPLPSGIAWFSLYRCGSIRDLPSLPNTLTDLQVNDCFGITRIESLPTSLSFVLIHSCPNLANLSLPASMSPRKMGGAVVRIQNCPILDHVSRIPDRLTYLMFDNCAKLSLVAPFPGSLHEVDIGGCPALAKLPPMPTWRPPSEGPAIPPGGLPKDKCDRLDHLLQQMYFVPGDPYSYYGIQFAKAYCAQPFPSHELLNLHLHASALGKKFGDLGVPASGAPFGIFAYDGKSLLPLRGQKGTDNLSRVLLEERTRIETLDPTTFALLLCNTVLPAFHEECQVVWSDGSSIRFRPIYPSYSPKMVEEFGASMFRDLKSPSAHDLPPPTVTGSADVGWKVHFAAQHMDMWKPGTHYVMYDISISPSYKLSISTSLIEAVEHKATGVY